MTKKAIYPGTFDPITNGHINIIQRSSELFDTVLVAVARSAGKSPLFDAQERLDMTKAAFSSYSNIDVVFFDGLLVDVAKQHQANVVVRGIRSIADFEYEAQMAGMNRQMMPELDTVFLTTDPEWGAVSSTLVRDIARFHGNITSFVPASVEQAILDKLS
ncbi:MAG: pantetheine-phosphate adenylyltransferase [Cycloclasticus sp.]|nr:pantetheine-phosphate adenylyltransferase [Cycloclasticus sp. 44_32_T64]